MEKLYTDWTLKNVISNYGKRAFTSVQLTGNYQESTFTFNEPGVVNGSFKTFTSSDMEASMVNMSLKANLVFRVNDGVERIGSTFLFNGNIGSDGFYDSRHQQLDHGRHMFIYSLNYKNNFTLCPGQISLFNINLKPAFFFKIAQNEPHLNSLLKGKQPEDFCLSFPLSFAPRSEYRNVLNAIYSNNFTGITRQLYIESKTFELFSLELNELLEAKNKSVNTYDINKADKDKLFAVHDFILKNFTEPLSLGGLAARFHINEFKLKKGYKLLFNETVFGHIHFLRMQMAKELLTSGDSNVAEAAYKVGYNNPNNFSTAFSKMFNYSPGRLLKKPVW